MTEPTIGDLLAQLEKQQARIERLEAVSVAPPTISDRDLAEAPDPGGTRMTRRGMLRTAAVGTAGVVGGMLVQPESEALAAGSKGPASFASTNTTPAVRATNTGIGNAVAATSGPGTAVHGSQTSAGPNQIAVRGIVDNKLGAGTGVVGSSPNGTGVRGSSTNGTGVAGSSGTGIGVTGTSASTNDNTSAMAGTITATAPGSFSAGVRGVNNGTGGLGIGVYGSQNGSGFGVYGYAPNGYGVVGQSAAGSWAVFGFGNIGATGTKSALVPAVDGRGHMTLYCMESPECWFEDFGSAKLSGGSTRVRIDPEFAQTVETGEYHVFLQPEGDCKGLSVREKTTAGFVVRELEGGTSDAPFAYRIVALRKDVAAPRLNRVVLPEAPQEVG